MALHLAPVAGLATLALATGCARVDSSARPVAAPLPAHRQLDDPEAGAAVAHSEASSSRHRLLAVDPQARPYRVRLPRGYVADGDEYVSRVRICVTPSGDVEDVAVVEPSIPAIDEQLPEVIAHWRYRPLVVDGQATAFCYPMSYRVY